MLCYWHRTVLYRGRWFYTEICTQPVTEVWTRYRIEYVDSLLKTVIPFCKEHGIDGNARCSAMLDIRKSEEKVCEALKDLRSRFLIEIVP